MKVRGVSISRQWQLFADGTHTCSSGRSAEGFDSTIVRVDTDAGITGWGEMAPLGSFYAPSFAAGAREGLRLLAPLVMGIDPRELARLNEHMDLHLNGHPYAKSALDVACWDIAAPAADLPLAEALGGRVADEVELYRSVSQDSPERMVATARHHIEEGYRRIQVEVGLDPDEDVERMEAVLAVLPAGTVVDADANGSWQPAQVRRFLRGTAHLDYTLEQPCADYENNLAIRSACDRPLVLDESIAHLSISTPKRSRAHTVDFHNCVTVSNAEADIACANARMRAPTSAGLGVVVDAAALGEPVAVFR